MKLNNDEYYRNRFIQKQIAYQCRYREVIIIKHLEDRDMTLRPFKIFKPEHFRWIYDRFHLDKIPFDIYISNASVKLPPLPSHPEKLKKARAFLNQNWEQLITGYDYYVDIDANNLKEEKQLIQWAYIIRKRLLEQEENYSIEIWTTGSGGVHIIKKGHYNPVFVRETIMDICCEENIPLRNPVKVIDGERYIPENQKWRKLKQDENPPIVEKPYVDNSIYDLRRIRRVPHSIHSKTGIPMKRVI